MSIHIYDDMDQSRWRLEETTLHNAMSRWKSDQYYLYSSMRPCYKKSEMNALLKQCQKTSLRYAVGQLLTQMKKMLDVKDVMTPFANIIYDQIR